MDTASSTILLAEKTKTPKKHFSEIFNDPKNTLIFMVVFSFAGAIIFIVVASLVNLIGREDKVASLQNSNKKAEVVVKSNLDTHRKQDVEHLHSAIILYYSKKQIYPQALSQLVPKYLVSIPKDPETQQEYLYRVSIDLKGFEVWAILDDGSEYLLGSS